MKRLFIIVASMLISMGAFSQNYTDAVGLRLDPALEQAINTFKQK